MLYLHRDAVLHLMMGARATCPFRFVGEDGKSCELQVLQLSTGYGEIIGLPESLSGSHVRWGGRKRSGIYSGSPMRDRLDG